MVNEKGLSPVIATLLLIVLAVASTAILWTWISNIIGRATGVEDLLVEKVILVTSTKIKVQIRNIGAVDANIVNIVVEKTNASWTETLSQSVEPGRIVVIDVNKDGDSGNFSKGDVITITITTAAGNRFVSKLTLQ